jgi:hypothetical protein
MGKRDKIENAVTEGKLEHVAVAPNRGQVLVASSEGELFFINLKDPSEITQIPA